MYKPDFVSEAPVAVYRREGQAAHAWGVVTMVSGFGNPTASLSSASIGLRKASRKQYDLNLKPFLLLVIKNLYIGNHRNHLEKIGLNPQDHSCFSGSQISPKKEINGNQSPEIKEEHKNQSDLHKKVMG
jgi:hypothetical protein